VRECGKCHKRVEEPQRFVTVPVHGWRHGIAQEGMSANQLYYHLDCWQRVINLATHT
jgi:hypothetical protein